MIKNDFRYIIKKILIGLGIFIGIFYFKSCSVSALSDRWYELRNVSDSSYNQASFGYASVGTTRTFIINNVTYNIQYKSDGIYVNDTLLTNSIYNGSFTYMGWNIFLDNVTNYVYIIAMKQNNTFFTYANSNTASSFPINFTRLSTERSNISGGSYLVYDGNTLIDYAYNKSYSSITANCPNNNHCFSNNSVSLYGTNMRVDLRPGNTTGNTNANDYFYSSNFGIPVIIKPPESKIVSLNPQPILSDDYSVLLGYNFTLEFDNFSTENFLYKYKVGTGRTFNFTTNNYQLSVRNNDTLYVWSEDLEGNVIDSESFTISDIGNIVDSNNIYDILFSSHGNGITDNQMYGVYNNVDINVFYKPDTNYLKYQYQYVNENGTIDNNNWTTHDSNILDINVTTNGTLYTRILDNSDNVVYSATFTNSIIGNEIVYNVDDDGINSFYNGIKTGINYNKPISNLLLFPVTLLSGVLNGMNATCVDYNLGSLYGYNLVLPCVNVRQYLGNELYFTIDLIFSGVLIFRIMCFIMRCYNGLIFMKNNPVDDLTGDGE